MPEHHEREVMKISDRSGSDSGSGGIGMHVKALALTPAEGKMSQCWDILPTAQLVTGSGYSTSAADSGSEETSGLRCNSRPK